MQFADVDLESCLGELFGIRKLEGKGNLTLALEATGDSVLALTRTLAGTGSLVARQGAVLLASGFVAGALVTWAIAGIVRNRWNGMPAPNLIAWFFGAVVLCLASGIACWLPARRAGRVDPVVALRAE